MLRNHEQNSVLSDSTRQPRAIARTEKWKREDFVRLLFSFIAAVLLLVLCSVLAIGNEPEDVAREVLSGPFVKLNERGEALITWQSRVPANTYLEMMPEGGALKKVPTTSEETRHQTTLSDLDLTTKYQFQIVGNTKDGRKFVSELFKFDPTLDYLPIESPSVDIYPQDELTPLYAQLAKEMVDKTGTPKGYAVVVGAGSGRLLAELVNQSQMHVIVVEQDMDKVQEIRRLFDDAGVYGCRLTVHHQEGMLLPFGPWFANLITSEITVETGTVPTWSEEIWRILRPAGGTVCLGSLKSEDNSEADSSSSEKLNEWFSNLSLDEGTVQTEGQLITYKRNKLPQSGEWTHMYGHPDNSSCSKDGLIGGKMSVLWWGRPGSRPMPDRGGRNPAPVSANGRMYVQGDRILFGIDAYNGTILWTKQLPTMRRANMPRDGSNMVATDKYLYLAVDSDCFVFDGQTGELVTTYNVERTDSGVAYNWGYLAVTHDMLLGTATSRGAQYLGDNGEWFEDFEAASVSRVTSDNFYARDANTGEMKWTYEDGVILNSTITIDEENVYFVESRNPQAIEEKENRLLEPVQQYQYLVALDLQTGDIKWEKSYDFSKCEFMTYLSYTNETLLVTGSDRDKNFHTYAFDSRNGYELWQHSDEARKKHHSGHLAHPVLIGDKLYHNKQTVELRTGNVLESDDFDWHGCGVMTASNNMLFRRFEYHGMYDLETKERSEFMGVRSGCWLSLIPSGGILLAPETGSGCFCEHALQTSIAFYPVNKVTADKE
ncbi:MAG: PQQ-binding-like beta-propeller repeat protein [Planctomycetaceae bacterium]|nr:PQQ-binding-like beta-propeller repeat protein [Planctomycetaceae bacterium]